MRASISVGQVYFHTRINAWLDAFQSARTALVLPYKFTPLHIYGLDNAVLTGHGLDHENEFAASDLSRCTFPEIVM
jgi:hypothetical protein